MSEREQERAAVVALLRAEARRMDELAAKRDSDVCSIRARTLRDAALAIEAGEHLKERT